MSVALPASGMALFFLLGMRHGIEPDHIAAIDGLTLRAHDHHERHAPWTGSLFALGHGLAIALDRDRHQPAGGVVHSCHRRCSRSSTGCRWCC